jgi:hypothetical protein
MTIHTCDNPVLGPKIQHLDNKKLKKSSEFGYGYKGRLEASTTLFYFNQGKKMLIRENSGKYQGILFSNLAGYPSVH